MIQNQYIKFAQKNCSKHLLVMDGCVKLRIVLYLIILFWVDMNKYFCLYQYDDSVGMKTGR